MLSPGDSPWDLGSFQVIDRFLTFEALDPIMSL
jgi:hypothetical protein